MPCKARKHWLSKDLNNRAKQGGECRQHTLNAEQVIHHDRARAHSSNLASTNCSVVTQE